MKDSKPGFNGQWIEVFATGSHTDNEGREHSITKDFLNQAVANFNSEEHEPPIVIGHPAENAPAFGWARDLRVNGDRLEAQFGDVNPEFESMVKNGAFKKRSASFYLRDGKPALRHVGFLGAQPPAVKGLRDIHFAEGQAAEFADLELRIADFGEGETMKDEDVATITERVVEKIKGIFGGKPAEVGTQNFSEADVKKLVGDSIKAVETSFGEKVTALENENNTLKKAVEKQASSMTRTEIVAFVESIGNAKLPPALRAGLVEFMESITASDKKVTVISFTEADGKKVETKTESSALDFFKGWLKQLPPMLSFGESYGAVQATGTDGAVLSFDEGRVKAMRSEMGIAEKK